MPRKSPISTRSQTRSRQTAECQQMASGIHPSRARRLSGTRRSLTYNGKRHTWATEAATTIAAKQTTYGTSRRECDAMHSGGEDFDNCKKSQNGASIFEIVAIGAIDGPVKARSSSRGKQVIVGSCGDCMRLAVVSGSHPRRVCVRNNWRKVARARTTR